MTKKDIAYAFSTGNFKVTYNLLDEDIQWNIIGDKLLNGKAAVIDFCDKTATYFAEVKTIFIVNNFIAEDNCIALNGTAQFITTDNNLTNMASCDVYIFKEEKLKEITSYCINTNNNN